MVPGVALGIARDDSEQPVGVVLGVGAAEGDEHALDLGLDIDGFVEEECLRRYVVSLPRPDLRKLVIVVERVEHEVRLEDTLAVVLEVDDLGLRDDRPQADHVVDRSRKDVIDEQRVALALAAVEKVGDSVDADEVVGSPPKDLRIGLVDVVVDIGLGVELVGHLEGAVDVADTALVVAVDVDGDLLTV